MRGQERREEKREVERGERKGYPALKWKFKEDIPRAQVPTQVRKASTRQ